MNEKIELQFKHTAEDFVQSSKFIQNRSPSGKYGLLISIFISLIFFLIAYLNNPLESFGYPVKLIFPIALGLISLAPNLYFTLKNQSGFFLKRQFKKDTESFPFLREWQTIIFDEEGLKGQDGFDEDPIYYWNEFTEVTKNKEYIFFFADNESIFFPKRAFKSEKQQSQFRELVKRKLGDKVKL